MAEPFDPSASPSLDRRSVLRLGGLSVVLAAVIAACGEDNGVGPEGITQAGSAPPLATAPSGKVTDTTLLRTATSLHYTAMDVIDDALTRGMSAEVTAAAASYRAVLQLQADALAAATTAAGGDPFEESNPVMGRRLVQPAVALLDVSQTPGDDAERLVHAVVSLAAATHQAFVPQFSDPLLRQAAMQIGAVHARAASVLARLISPENVVPVAEAEAAAAATVEAPESDVATGLPTTVAEETTTTAAGAVADVEVYQIPAAYGSLAPIQIALGDSTQIDGPTKRAIVTIETPSLNSLVYDE